MIVVSFLIPNRQIIDSNFNIPAIDRLFLIAHNILYG
jgi:hypothetical protein